MTIAVKANPDGSGTFLHNGTEVLKMASTAIDALSQLRSLGSPVVTFADHVGNLATNGYHKFPNGLIIQWGYASYLSGDGQSGKLVPFNTPFPNSCFVVVSSDSGGSGANPTAAVVVDRTQFRAYGKSLSTGTWADTGIGWVAFGF